MLEELAAAPRVVAIGETGLDFFRDRAPREDQRRAFERPDRGRPPWPSRWWSTCATGGGRKTTRSPRPSGRWRRRPRASTVVLHCFSAPPARVAEAAERGWLCSFAGNVTIRRRRSCARRRGWCPRSCSWSRPTHRSWRRSPSRQAEPARQCGRDGRGGGRGAGRPYAELDALVEAKPPAPSGGEAWSDWTELPRRPEPAARRSFGTPELDPRTSCSRWGVGRAPDRAARSRRVLAMLELANTERNAAEKTKAEAVCTFVVAGGQGTTRASRPQPS